MNALHFVQGSLDEFKKISWPSRKKTLELTAVVLGVSAIVGLYITVLDTVFTRLVEVLIQQ